MADKKNICGVLFIHSAPAAMCPHIEWAVSAAVGTPARFQWTVQPVTLNSFRAEYSWTAAPGIAASIASALQGWPSLRFEVTEDACDSAGGLRYSYTPSLGIFQAATGPHGDIMVHEDRIRDAIARASAGKDSLENEMAKLIGKPWDDELEVFREAHDDAPVRWLYEVV